MIKELKLYAIISSVVGFLITALLTYPYGCHWDSGWVFSHIYADGEPYLNNWMGWYYPILWYVLYKITGIYHIMGTYQLLLYWVSITIIYIFGCNGKKKDFICFLCFAFFPINLFFITSITNNALVYCYLLMSLAFLVVYDKKNKEWSFYVSIFFLLNVLFIRRDTFLFVLPFTIALLYVKNINNKSTIRKLFKSTVTVVISILLIFGIEHIFTSSIKNYSKIKNIQYIALYDLTGMSRDSGKLLWPDDIIAKEYLNSDSTIMNSIIKTKGLYGDVDIFYNHDINKYLKTRYHLAPDLHNFFSIYMHHIPEYIRWRCGMIWKTLTNDYGIIHQCDGMEGINYPIKPPRILHNKIAWWYPKIFRMIVWYVLIVIVLTVCDFLRLFTYRNKKQMIICRSVSISAIFTMLITSICLISDQNRYFFPYFLLVIGTYLYFYGNSLIIKKN